MKTRLQPALIASPPIGLLAALNACKKGLADTPSIRSSLSLSSSDTNSHSIRTIK